MVGAATSLGGVTRMTGMLQCSPFITKTAQSLGTCAKVLVQ